MSDSISNLAKKKKSIHWVPIDYYTLKLYIGAYLNTKSLNSYFSHLRINVVSGDDWWYGWSLTLNMENEDEGLVDDDDRLGFKVRG